MIEKKLKSALVLVCGVVAFSLSSASISSVDLISNGSFEETNVSGKWQAFNSPADVAGWDFSDESAMEIWNTPFVGTTADTGTKIAELNAHGGTGQYTFFQSFETVVNELYNYSFAYQKRRGNTNQQFTASIYGMPGNVLIEEDTFSNHVFGEWSIFNGTFKAVSEMSAIAFASGDSLGDTTGNLIDSVSVTAVPEPGSLALFALGLAGLGYSRRKAK